MTLLESMGPILSKLHSPGLQNASSIRAAISLIHKTHVADAESRRRETIAALDRKYSDAKTRAESLRDKQLLAVKNERANIATKYGALKARAEDRADRTGELAMVIEEREKLMEATRVQEYNIYENFRYRLSEAGSQRYWGIREAESAYRESVRLAKEDAETIRRELANLAIEIAERTRKEVVAAASAKSTENEEINL